MTQTHTQTQLQNYGSREAEARQANWLIEASSSMTLAEKRVIYYLLSQVNPLHPAKPLEYEIKIQHFAEVFGLNYISGPLYSMVKQAISSLWSRDVRIKEKDGTITLMRYLQQHTYHDRQGYLSLKITDALASGIYSLQSQYTTILISNLTKLTSSYSFKLYELLWQFKEYGANKTQTRKTREISVEDLRFYFGCENTYPIWASFSRRTILPAVQEINGKTNIFVDFELIKKGKKVNRVLFFFGLKSDFPEGMTYQPAKMPERPKLKRAKKLDLSGLSTETVELVEKFKNNTNHFPFEEIPATEAKILLSRFLKFREEQLEAAIVNLRFIEAWGRQLEKQGGKLPAEDVEKLTEYRTKIGVLCHELTTTGEEVVKRTIKALEEGAYGISIKQLQIKPEDFITQSAAELKQIEQTQKVEKTELIQITSTPEKKGRGRPKKNKVFSFNYPGTSEDNLPF